MEYLFIVLLTLQCLILLIHDWINIFPINDVRGMNEVIPRPTKIMVMVGNVLPPVLVLVMESRLFGRHKPLGVGLYFAIYFGITLAMMYLSWYHPYFFGATAEEKERYRKAYGRTLQILPRRGDNPRPNTIHLFLHTIFIVNAVLSLLIGFNLV